MEKFPRVEGTYIFSNIEGVGLQKPSVLKTFYGVWAVDIDIGSRCWLYVCFRRLKAIAETEKVSPTTEHVS